VLGKVNGRQREENGKWVQRWGEWVKVELENGVRGNGGEG